MALDIRFRLATSISDNILMKNCFKDWSQSNTNPDCQATQLINVSKGAGPHLSIMQETELKHQIHGIVYYRTISIIVR